MPRKRLIDIRWPLAGLNEKVAYRQQPPFTSPRMSNVVSKDTTTGRERGGSRPGMSRVYDISRSRSAALNDTYINGIGFLPVLNGNYAQDKWDSEKEDFDDGIPYTAASWRSANARDFGDGTIGASNGDGTRGWINTFPASATPTSPAYLSVKVLPDGAVHNSQIGFVFISSGSTDPRVNGAVVTFTITGTGTITVNYSSWIANVLTSNINDSFPVETTLAAGVIECRILEAGGGTLLVDVYWNGVKATQQTLTVANTDPNRSDDYGMEFAAPNAGDCLVDDFLFKWDSNNGTSDEVVVFMQRDGFLHFISNHHLYNRQPVVGIGGDNTPVQFIWNRPSAVEMDHYGSELFIADPWPIQHQGSGGFAINSDSTLLELTSASFPDWTGVAYEGFVCQLATSQDAQLPKFLQMDVVGVDPGDPSKLLVKRPGVASPTGSTTNFIIGVAPKVLGRNVDYQGFLEYTNQVLDTYGGPNFLNKGLVPLGVEHVAVIFDRLIYAASSENKSQWYASRPGNPFDFDYGAGDAARAISGANSDAGQISDIIVGLAPIGDDALLFGCQSSIWVMKGDPGFGGIVYAIDRLVGMVDKKAWTHGPAGELYFMSRQGLYLTRNDGTSGVTPLSIKKLPRRLLNLDRKLWRTVLDYDFEEQGIYIEISPTPFNAGASKQTLFYRIGDDSWWDWTTPYTAGASLQLPARSQEAKLLWGHSDGKVRQYRAAATDDDGVAISSFIDIGPIRLGGNDIHEGMLAELSMMVAQSSGVVDWELRVAESEEDTLSAPVFVSGSAQPGVTRQFITRARGQAFLLRLKNGDANPWAVERVTGKLYEMGLYRRA